MKAVLDCIPCLVRQTVELVCCSTDDRQLQEQLLKDVLAMLSEMDLKTSPPLMTQAVHRLIRERTSVRDPYCMQKRQFNQIALELYSRLKSQVQNSVDPLEASIKLAIAANVIDLGANGRLSVTDIQESLDQVADAPLVGQLLAFREAISRAERILYLTDNAGEIVFDRYLIEQLPIDRLTVAVRGTPILNDATMVDAEAVGLTDFVEVIENGSDAPGTVLEDCDPEFRRRFETADVVIAKGQGNYETLSEEERDIFFLLKVKCPVVSRDLDCEPGSLILGRSAYGQRRSRESG